MKTIRNLFLVFALTASFAVADDGHTGSGDRCSTCTPPACTENCGGFAAEEPGVVTVTETGTNGEETSFVEYWTEVFLDLIG